jgi:hypothetical protein
MLHVEALVHCNRHLTDGKLARKSLRRITDSEDLAGDVEALVEVGLWVETDEGWDIDWSDQERADDVRRRQEGNAERQRKHRQHAAGDHSLCASSRCKAARDTTSDVTRDVTDNETGNVTAPRPIPARPGPKEPGQGRRCPTGSLIASDGTCCGVIHNQPVDNPETPRLLQTVKASGGSR